MIIALINRVKLAFDRVWHRSGAHNWEQTREHEHNQKELDKANTELWKAIQDIHRCCRCRKTVVESLLDDELDDATQKEMFRDHVKAALTTHEYRQSCAGFDAVNARPNRNNLTDDAMMEILVTFIYAQDARDPRAKTCLTGGLCGPIAASQEYLAEPLVARGHIGRRQRPSPKSGRPALSPVAHLCCPLNFWRDHLLRAVLDKVYHGCRRRSRRLRWQETSNHFRER